MSERFERVVEFTAGDGLQCNVINVRGEREPTKGPVLLVHGAGVRAKIFRAPSGRNLVDVLVEDGWDVWFENWRASIDIPHNHWTLDQAAVYDHPRAVRDGVLADRNRLDQGGDPLSGFDQLHDECARRARSAGKDDRLQRRLGPSDRAPPCRLEAAQHDPGYRQGPRLPGSRSGDGSARLGSCPSWWTLGSSSTITSATTACASGRATPTAQASRRLWRHENLNEATHEWLKGEFAAVPLTFFSQILKCVRAGRLLTVEHHSRVAARLHSPGAAHRRSRRVPGGRAQQVLHGREPTSLARLVRESCP